MIGDVFEGCWEKRDASIFEMKKLKQTFVLARNVFAGRGFLPEIRKMRCRKMRCPGIGKIVLTTNGGSWEAKESCRPIRRFFAKETDLRNNKLKNVG